MQRCIYCGAPATERDHLVAVATKPRRLMGRKTYNFGQTVPACGECNSTLRDIPYVTIRERAEFLISEYEKRWSRILLTPKWSRRDIAELGPQMRNFVLVGQETQQSAVKRLKKLRIVAAKKAPA